MAIPRLAWVKKYQHEDTNDCMNAGGRSMQVQLPKTLGKTSDNSIFLLINLLIG